MTARLALLFALGCVPRIIPGQGVTTAAMEGRVVGQDGAPVAGALVRLVNQANGARWERGTRPDGTYLFDVLGVGTYRAEVRAMGFIPQVHANVALALGQRHVADFMLSPAAVTLAAMTVTADAHAVLNAGRTGPAEIIMRQSIADLPNLGRSFLGVTLLSPQVASSPITAAVPTGGISIGGQNRLYNRFQVDGGTHHDAYRGQSPGRQSLPRPMSLEVLEEVQVLAAPFDVRHGDFAGGLVNAVTRSGGNDVTGSLFAYVTDARLVRRAGIAGRVGDFTTSQFGGTLAGPIVRDRAHVIVSLDVQRRAVPDPGPLITDTAGGADVALIGISHADAVRFRDILRAQYGFDAGALGPVNATAPAADAFAKVSLQLATNNRLELSQHYTSGDRQDFMLRTRGQYFLSSFAQSEPASLHASRLTWTRLMGLRWSNELRLSYLRERDACQPATLFPEIRVNVSARNTLVAGTAGGCHGTSLRQDILELRNDATGLFGPHVLTMGAHGELLRFRDDLLQGSPGLWVFSSLDSLSSGRPRQYQRTLPGPRWDGAIGFRAGQLALYAQDRWSASRALTITAGVRVDAPQLPSGGSPNAMLRDSLGIETGRLPVGALWSPRLGFNYNVHGAGHTFIRGGIGLFAGRPPYRWLSNALRDDGTVELLLDCRGSQVPTFTGSDQPAACVTAGPRPRLSAFDPRARFPQNLKVAAGVDRRVAGQLVGTVDVLYTRAVHQFYLTNVNLRPSQDVSEGEANRPLYGTIAAGTGAATPALRVPTLDAVTRVRSRSGDHALTFTAQVRGELRYGVHGSVQYSHTRSRDRMWLAHFPARALLEGTVLEGTLQDRALATSWYDVPHRVLALGTLRLPLRTRLMVSYSGSSGRRFTYTVQGDANADGLGVTLRQDPVYVPRDSQDVSLTNPAMWGPLNAYIESVPCLRGQRGRLMARNSCRNPWFGLMNARMVKEIVPARGGALEITVDVYNVMNLINARKGLSRYDGLTFGKDLLLLRGYDAAAGRGIYAFEEPPRIQVEDMASRWQIELGVRYVFR